MRLKEEPLEKPVHTEKSDQEGERFFYQLMLRDMPHGQQKRIEDGDNRKLAYFDSGIEQKNGRKRLLMRDAQVVYDNFRIIAGAACRFVVAV